MRFDSNNSKADLNKNFLYDYKDDKKKDKRR